ncbi:hypothetical protein C5615_35900 [Burkholderia cepacia]|uniref:Uncharacterized protein n=1 Tax=Burkholderia cepacia TaxID=292 RepID=A0A2S8I212_BURCE|nr:hypothetical protein [Burkholderia cepacia]PQP08739.1 hypothetical protein C5615_35900 [Burkholderia cepacia]HDR9511708.1 hypothetical protein [Burkholderia cepacia]
MAIKLTHETTPYIARTIVESGTFVAGPILGDGGMNACIEGVAYNPDQAELTGAFVDFEWTGPIESGPARAGHEPNVLYDEQPHRAFVFVCTSKHLHVTGVRFRTGLSWRNAVRVPSRPAGAELFSLPAWSEWIQTWSPKWLDKASIALETTMLAKLSSKPSVSIVPPKHCPYLFILRERGLI